jgi:trans-L-3-hydroxyproline dehydratase
MREENIQDLISYGMKIKRAIMKTRKIIHPFDEDMGFLYGTIFTGKAHGNTDSRNVCIFAEGEVDRSPTGTGVSARAALHHVKGELKPGKEMIIESIIGTTFSVKIIKLTKFAAYDAVIPEVNGMAYIIGRNELLIDPNDPLKRGFMLR